jgi:hypothetical protein
MISELEGMWEEANVFELHALFCYFYLETKEYPEEPLYIAGLRVKIRKLALPNTNQEYHPLCRHIRCVFLIQDNP